MIEAEKELYKLGIPVKTRHNEVAPGQFEIAPIFENCNIAADHQQLMMITLKRIARNYGFECLLHEKPYDGLNGSGKHLNWSMSTSDGMNLLEPGDNPHDNMQFLFFFTAVLKAVHDHQDLLRISIAHAGNDHRLGANEAPPAIISAFIGDQLQDVLQQLMDGGLKESKQGGLMGLGTPVLPALPKHAGDRNRTSPFAFTGNKFEFRAVGSSQSISFPIVVLNTIISEAMDELCTGLEEEMDSNDSLEEALSKLLQGTLGDIKDIVFNGDGYSEDWTAEAEKRGLLNLPTTMDALPKLTEPKNIELFKKYEVLNEREIHSRQEIWTEQYLTTINIEADTTEEIAKKMVYPAAIRYMNELAENVSRVDGLGMDTTGSSAMLNKVNGGLNDLNQALENLRDAVLSSEEEDDVISSATAVKNKVIPAMDDIRDAVDYLERHTADDYWPLPIYREMLFVK